MVTHKLHLSTTWFIIISLINPLTISNYYDFVTGTAELNLFTLRNPKLSSLITQKRETCVLVNDTLN
jgi:hypothetical protein